MPAAACESAPTGAMLPAECQRLKFRFDPGRFWSLLQHNDQLPLLLVPGPLHQWQEGKEANSGSTCFNVNQFLIMLGQKVKLEHGRLQVTSVMSMFESCDISKQVGWAPPDQCFSSCGTMRSPRGAMRTSESFFPWRMPNFYCHSNSWGIWVNVPPRSPCITQAVQT